ncbi:MAG: sensor histidine kinase [Shimia sp.]
MGRRMGKLSGILRLHRLDGMMNRLPVRLLGLLSLALFPLALISVYQTWNVLQEAERIARSSLMERTFAVSAQERALVREAFGAADAMASVVALQTDAECSAMVADFVDRHPEFVFAGYFEASGRMGCTPTGAVYDFSDADNLATFVERGIPTIVFNANGRVSQAAVTIVSHPVVRDGTLVGGVSISIPLVLATGVDTAKTLAEDVDLSVVNVDGDVVNPVDGMAKSFDRLPVGVDAATLFERIGTTFSARDALGRARVFAVTDLIPGSAIMVGSWDALGPDTSLVPALALPLLFPIAMWAAGIVVAYFGIQTLVIGHVSDLRGAMRRFALGERDLAAFELRDPPAEFEEAERAFQRMARIITKAETQREQDLEDKEVLLKEVHHRVKNNLQLIASIMNMQARRADSDEAKVLLKGLQWRVRGLATLHRTLYTTPDLATVDASELVREVGHEVSNLAAQSGMSINFDLDEITLYPDQAVPLSMLVAEALTNAAKYAGRPPRGLPRIDVVLKSIPGGDVLLTVRNTKGPDALEGTPGGGGLGARLMGAFEGQLNATSDVEETDDAYTYRVTFPLHPFEAA